MRTWLQRKTTPSNQCDAPTQLAAAAAPKIGAALRTTGHPIEAATRDTLGTRMSYDFSRVRVHADEHADAASRALRARAFTIGQDIFFRAGAYAPALPAGMHLLAHELAHTIQQSGGEKRIQRAPADDTTETDADPICATFNFETVKSEVGTKTSTYKTSQKTEDKLLLIRALKLILRCATTEQQKTVKTALDTALGADATAIWDEAGTAFGGFTGMYPGYAPDIKKRLKKLGVSETLEFGAFQLSDTGATHKKRAKATATKELPDLGRTDIVYFRGHQFAQYKAPGVFTDGDVETGFDLRYIDQKGGFPNVKIVISTSCATLCKEAFDVFHSLFPKAVILGYRKSAPIDGAGVRDAFHKGIVGLRRPLLLDQPVDITSILSVWKSVIESKHKGQKSPMPGYYDGTTLHYWDGAAWKSITPSDATNKCKSKGDESSSFPAP